MQCTERVANALHAALCMLQWGAKVSVTFEFTDVPYVALINAAGDL